MWVSVPTGVTNLVQWDILRALFEGPHTFISVKALAAWIGRDQEAILEDVQALIAHGLLERHEQDGHIVYTLPADPERRRQVEDFLLACRDEEACLSVVAQLIRSDREREQPQ